MLPDSAKPCFGFCILSGRKRLKQLCDSDSLYGVLISLICRALRYDRDYHEDPGIYPWIHEAAGLL